MGHCAMCGPEVWDIGLCGTVLKAHMSSCIYTVMNRIVYMHLPVLVLDVKFYGNILPVARYEFCQFSALQVGF